MTEYPCPKHIKDRFRILYNAEGVVCIPDDAGQAYLIWAQNMHKHMKPGDRIEVFGSGLDDADDQWYWWDYKPRDLV